MSYPYPPEIFSRIKPSSGRELIKANAIGRAATFLCGVSAKFELEIDSDEGVIKDVIYSTNGCGYVVAAANVVAETLRGTKLVDLNALELLDSTFDSRLGIIPGERQHCINTCVDAVQTALANFRKNRVDEWVGEDALICSCFGVSESQIESLINEKDLETVETVGDVCKAGTGCGSCQQLIQDLLDSTL